ncbi:MULTISPECIES: archaemetzincin family Zn-dependent metalloprotease [unclassified Nitratiruptor]|uniref:archaemetzincin family Zn-dependent metalloprotease n=1 Tax=unclassified Nitratiruptor TaxID=2624044 RepID=UPI0019153F8B|nr:MULTISPECIES: archaemetzincin family Zn-dependent metalloprotease [unclassified Nitratiruptor]BCD59983.1 archaemetzincin [Nitratiruptor sp. YY08-10]BCD63906.1 archaemetzincin [Nitratiruptor sp. YY08-14]
MCYKRVLFVGFSWYEPTTIAFLQDAIQEVLGIESEFVSKVSLPQKAYHLLRRQYLASAFLEQLLFFKTNPSDIVLGITGEDLYEPNLNFVFGIATPLYGVAIIGTKRLHNSFYGLHEDAALYYRRVAIEAIHEIGHVLGLSHCENPHCVMHFSNTLAEADTKGYRFCPNCEEKAKKAICTDKI